MSEPIPAGARSNATDAAAPDEEPPEDAVRKLAQELVNFDASLGDKPRWLVFTKTDLVAPGVAEEIAQRVLAALDWKAPWFMISSVTHAGTDELVQAVARALDEMKELEQQEEWKEPGT